MTEKKTNLKEGEASGKLGSLSIENLPMINVGVVGHIDHGKTTLLSRLTGKFADTHSEELKRGITIKLGYAESIIGEGKNKRYVSYVDAPGHEMLMATMLSGAAMMDAAILVVAANEGIKPQTSEHLIALKAKNIQNIIIVQNKIDLVNEEQAKKNYMDLKEFVKGTPAENSPIIPVSAQQEINIDLIKQALLEIKIPERDIKSEPLFFIARSFDINKPGKLIKDLNGGVIAGILKQGILKIGDEIEIKPGLYEKKANQMVYQTLTTKITGIRRGSYKLEQATPGGSLAIETELDNILTKTDSLSGCVASSKKMPEITDVINIEFELFPEVLGTGEKTKVDEIKAGEAIMLSINTSITVGTVKKVKDNKAEVHLKIPIVPLKQGNIGIARNINSHWRLIGFGNLQ